MPNLPTTARAENRRFLSVGAKLAAATSMVLVLISALAFVQLNAMERTRLIAAKTSAAAMLSQLLATELAATLEFAAEDDAALQLDHLHSNADIVGAAVWSGASRIAIARWDSPGTPALEVPLPSEPDGSTVTPDFLVTTQTITGRTGKAVGRLRIVFSLAPENRAFRAVRRRLLAMTGGVTVLTAVLLLLLARRYVVRPLSRLSAAATSLALGQPSEHLAPTSNDEIGDLTRAFNVMGEAVVARQQRLQEEMHLAQHIQTAILPRSLEVSGLEIDAVMLPAADVGGDYYDVLPTEDGCWIGIGDVAGHGLDAGLIMLMMQSMIAALVRRDPNATPREVLCALNECLFDNIRNRLRRDDHATLTILRYEHSGRLTFAGAHEDILVYRADQGRCESIQTPGTWVGARKNIKPGTVDSVLQLRPGDVMLLYTDGVTELRNAGGVELGLDRLSAELQRMNAEPVARIKAQLLELLRGWSDAPDDDVTLLVVRYEGR